MGKRARERDLADNEAKAVSKMLRVSPQKLNLVAQLIRGKKVASALIFCIVHHFATSTGIERDRDHTRSLF